MSGPGQILEEPTQIDDDADPMPTAEINNTIEVERINEFHGELDPNYQAIVRAFDVLCKEAAQKSKVNWETYEANRSKFLHT